MKLLIAVPSHGLWEAAMAHSLAVTMADLAANPGPSAIRLTRCEGSKLASNRTELVREALRNEADSILWVDTDLSFRPDSVRSLLSRDLDIVAANYAKKIPSQDSVSQALDGTPVTARETGIEEVGHVGMGLCLTKTDVFRRIELPWFQFQWSEKNQDDVGEDVYLCRKLRAAGIKVYVDHDASKGVKHIGRFSYVVS
jgi:hypothetical protein